MAEFALYIKGDFKEIRQYAEKPENIKHKGVAWYPVAWEYGEPYVGLEKGSHVIRKADPETLPLPVPDAISDWQFFQQLAVMGLITEQEAEDAVASGTLPATLAALVEMLPEQARFSARMLLKGSTTFRRDHDMTDTIAWLYGFDSDAVDELFRAAGSLA